MLNNRENHDEFDKENIGETDHYIYNEDNLSDELNDNQNPISFGSKIGGFFQKTANSINAFKYKEFERTPENENKRKIMFVVSLLVFLVIIVAMFFLKRFSTPAVKQPW